MLESLDLDVMLKAFFSGFAPVFFQFLLPIFLVTFVFKLIKGIFLSRKRNSNITNYLNKYSELDDLKRMHEKDFEYLVADLFSKMGYQTNVVGGSRDGGIDVVAKKNGLEHYIQCKRYNGSVGVSQVRDFLGAIVSKRTEGKSFFVTTGIFSLEAEKFAQDKPIELIDGQKLINMVKNKGIKIEKQEIKEEEKKCPECDGVLLKKSGKHGFFLGCSNFPKCRYTKSF